MKFLASNTLRAAVAAALLAGCSGNMSTPSPGTGFVGQSAFTPAQILTKKLDLSHLKSGTSVEVALQMNNWDTGPGPYYVTANGPPIGESNCGPGQVALHDNATTIGPEEKFTMVNEGNNVYAFRLFRSHYYITAVDGGDVSSPSQEYGYSQLSTNATSVGQDQIFTIIPKGRHVALQTSQKLYGKPTYVTAIAGCGTTNTVPFHTNATTIGTWEKFTLIPE